MPEFLAPGVYIEEISTKVRPIEGVPTSTLALIGVSEQPPDISDITSLAEYRRIAAPDASPYLSGAVRGFFDNGGQRCIVLWQATSDSVEAVLERVVDQPVSVLGCPDQDRLPTAAATLGAYCARRRDRLCILHAPQPTMPHATHEPLVRSSFAAYYHPWVIIPTEDGAGHLTVPPVGHVAGLYARTDREHGVWKSPAGIALAGVTGLSQQASPAERDLLHDRGINVLRQEPGRGILVWGARTTNTDPEWKYVAVRRFVIYVEQSLRKGLQWVVVEPGGSALWESVRHTCERFLSALWRQGALVGQRAEDAYFVRCDRTTMTQDDVDNGRLIALVGIAPSKPAEFVVLRITCQSPSPPT